MTYSPAQVGIQDGTDYFTSLGLIGGSTGMTPLIVNNPNMSSPDAWGNNLTLTTTGSLLKMVASNSNWTNMSWDLGGSTYDKVLGVVYYKGLSRGVTIGFEEDAFSGSQATTDYSINSYRAGAYTLGSFYTYIQKYVAGLGSNVAQDFTLSNNMSVAYSTVFGIALYIDTSSNVQTVFYKMGSNSQWFQGLTTADTSLTTGWKSFILTRGNASTSYAVSPMMVWGAV